MAAGKEEATGGEDFSSGAVPGEVSAVIGQLTFSVTILKEMKELQIIFISIFISGFLYSILKLLKYWQPTQKRCKFVNHWVR